MMNKVELLAPAGNWDAFVAAVENGADAVYLGVKNFNARQNAENFTEEEAVNAINYAHVRGARVYLTLNTLVADDEMREVVETACRLYQKGIDGVIVQDVGMASLLRKAAPGLELHGSTQMTIYDSDGVKVLKEMGFKRVVLARELSLDEIGKICNDTDLEIEVFVHGALCVSYSGQCLLSSIIGGRSGNRGLCAQPCRQKYKLVSKSYNPFAKESPGYLLSTKDICALKLLPDLVKRGVKALKIEGRMKSPEYVAAVVRIYRKYLDMVIQKGKIDGISNADWTELMKAFNRGGFSTGYLEGKKGADMMCYEKPKNWGTPLGEVVGYNVRANTANIKLSDTLSIGDSIEVWNGKDDSPSVVVSSIMVNNMFVNSAYAGQKAVVNITGDIKKGDRVYKITDREFMERNRTSFLNPDKKHKILVEGVVNVSEGQPVELVVTDKDGNSVSVKGTIPAEKAINVVTTQERIREQIVKTGGTPFDFSDVKVNIEDGILVPISEINACRRAAFEQLEKVRIENPIKAYESARGTCGKLDDMLNIDAALKKGGTIHRLSLYFLSMEKADEYTDAGVRRVYLPLEGYISDKNRYMQVLRKFRNSNTEVYCVLPAVMRAHYASLGRNTFHEMLHEGVDGFSISNIGSIEILRNSIGNARIHADYNLNIYNRYSFVELGKHGIQSGTLSPELTLKKIKEISMLYKPMSEIIIHGRIPVMVSEYCPTGCIRGGMSASSSCKGACKSEKYYLRDRMGLDFPVLSDPFNCTSTILNSKPFCLARDMDKLLETGADLFRINVSVEDSKEIKNVIAMYGDILKNGTGVLQNQYRGLIEQIEKKGFTKGHYFRGVE